MQKRPTDAIDGKKELEIIILVQVESPPLFP